MPKYHHPAQTADEILSLEYLPCEEVLDERRVYCVFARPEISTYIFSQKQRLLSTERRKQQDGIDDESCAKPKAKDSLVSSSLDKAN